MNIFKKNGFYVMALVLVAGILAGSGIAGYVSGQKERGAENAVDFKDDGAGTALNAPASAFLRPNPSHTVHVRRSIARSALARS